MHAAQMNVLCSKHGSRALVNTRAMPIFCVETHDSVAQQFITVPSEQWGRPRPRVSLALSESVVSYLSLAVAAAYGEAGRIVRYTDPHIWRGSYAYDTYVLPSQDL